jgi:hypothetical protein
MGIVDIENPVGPNGLTQTLALDNELLAAVLSAGFIPIEVDPLKVRPLQFSLRAGLVVWIGLIIALGYGTNFVFGIQFTTRFQQAEIEEPV